MERKNKNRGFTLIELLVVISIIGLLSSVVLVSLANARQKARDSKRVGEMNQLSKAFELFYNDAGAYPTGTGAPGTTYTIANTGAVFGSDLLQAKTSRGQFFLTPTYILSVPVSPLPFESNACTAANNSYYYETNVNGTWYTLTFCIGTTSGSLTTAGVHTLTPNGFR
jgi:prepilin-type N-terminal cleavage/methylation domain-containing protein